MSVLVTLCCKKLGPSMAIVLAQLYVRQAFQLWFSIFQAPWLHQVRPNPTLFFRVGPNFAPKILVELSWVGNQGKKIGPIESGWSQIGCKFGCNPIMYLINLNETNLNPISDWVEPPGSKFRLSWVGLVGFIWLH